VIDLTGDDDEPAQKKPRLEEEVKVIGISGCSRSGKSTLACEISRRLGDYGALVVHLDKLHPGGRPEDWEVTEKSIKLREAEQEVEKAIRNAKKLVVVEGFRAFAFPSLVSRMSLLLWLDVPKDVAKRDATRQATLSGISGPRTKSTPSKCSLEGTCLRWCG